MKIKLLLALALLLLGATSAFAQAGGAANGSKTKVAIIDVLSFRDQVGELKAKYEKLQNEFTPKYKELEAMQAKIANQEKVLSENKNLTPQQAAKLTEDMEALKRDYNRTLEDSQGQAQRREREETEAIYDKLSKFMDQYCAKNGITHVFDARRLQETGMVVYAAGTANITDDFIKEYNKANPVQAASTK